MGVTLTASEKRGVVADLGFPDNSGGMVEDQAFIGIYNYYMIFKSGLNGYSDQVALPDKHQKFMDASVEAIDDDIVLKFKNLLIEEGGNDTIVDCLPTFIYEFLTLLVRDMAQIG